MKDWGQNYNPDEMLKLCKVSPFEGMYYENLKNCVSRIVTAVLCIQSSSSGKELEDQVTQRITEIIQEYSSVSIGRALNRLNSIATIGDELEGGRDGLDALSYHLSLDVCLKSIAVLWETSVRLRPATIQEKVFEQIIMSLNNSESNKMNTLENVIGPDKDNNQKVIMALNDPYHADIKARVEAGKLKFIIGPSDWPTGYYTDPYSFISIPFALALADAMHDIDEIKIYYHRPSDFHHIRFKLEEEEYIVRWYKTWILCRKSDGYEIDFGRNSHNIIHEFARGLHKKGSLHWHRGNTTNHTWSILLKEPDEFGDCYTM